MSVKHPLRGQVLVSQRFSAIVLAAGAGRRFGGAKLTAPWRGGVLLDGALAAAFAAPAEEVILVQGADPRVGAAARAFAGSRGETTRLKLIDVPDWAHGLSASLRAALAAVPPEREGAFVFLGDMPQVPPEMAGRLADRLVGEAQAVAPEVDGQLGHPTLIRADLFPIIAAVEGDQGARGVLQALGRRLARAPVEDPGVLFDVDVRDALTA